MTDDAKFTLTLNLQQLHWVNTAIEVLARCRIGQFSDLMIYLPLKDDAGVVEYEVARQIEAIVKPLMGLTPNQSWGVGHDKDTDLLFDLHQVIRHHLSWRRAKLDGEWQPGQPRKPEQMGVHFDEPFHWNSQVPLAKLEEVVPEDPKGATA